MRLRLFGISSVFSDMQKKKLKRLTLIQMLSLGVSLMGLTQACENSQVLAPSRTQVDVAGVVSDSPSGPLPIESPSPEDRLPPEAPSQRSWSVDALLFAGSGTWAAEVSSLKSILSARGASYIEVSSAELNAMTLEEISEFGVLIFPGGSGGTQAGSLSSSTKALLRQAVQERGVGYTGFCAGAFIAVAPTPAPGRDVVYGLGVAEGPVLDYYYLENQGVTAQMTLLQLADGSTRDVLWYGGPVTPDQPGDVIARYPNGDASISQLTSGAGLVVISGGHPGVPASSKSAFGLVDSDGLDYELTWSMISAAMNHQRLPAD
jgi:glutamine amidotransferase-like uncharacterized protein